MSVEWEYVLPGRPPDSLRGLPCDQWIPKEDGKGGWLLLCLFCDKTPSGWHHPIPDEDLESAWRFYAAIEEFYKEEE